MTHNNKVRKCPRIAPNKKKKRGGHRLVMSLFSWENRELRWLEIVMAHGDVSFQLDISRCRLRISLVSRFWGAMSKYLSFWFSSHYVWVFI